MAVEHKKPSHWNLPCCSLLEIRHHCTQAHVWCVCIVFWWTIHTYTWIAYTKTHLTVDRICEPILAFVGEEQMTKLERTTRFLIKAKPLFSEKPIEVSIFENRKKKFVFYWRRRPVVKDLLPCVMHDELWRGPFTISASRGPIEIWKHREQNWHSNHKINKTQIA